MPGPRLTAPSCASRARRFSSLIGNGTTTSTLATGFLSFGPHAPPYPVREDLGPPRRAAARRSLPALRRPAHYPRRVFSRVQQARATRRSGAPAPADLRHAGPLRADREPLAGRRADAGDPAHGGDLRRE